MQITKTILALTSLTLATNGSAACKEGELQCGGGNPGGAVFICKNGRWKVLMECGSAESCTTDPVPTCSWGLTNAGSTDDAVAGFETSAADAGAEAKAEVAVNNKDINDTNDNTATEITALGYNTCSPCIRYHDSCVADCESDGDSSCVSRCDKETCVANLLTGDIRKPIISCGKTCKWSCY